MPKERLARCQWGLVVLLVVALGLRVVLVLRGGQGFWGDETRYDASHGAIAEWESGHVAAGWLALVGSADHLGFKIQMLLPAWWQARFEAGAVTGALYLALFSTANILWVWRLARRLGGSEVEALAAAVAMAASNSMFYWVRHLVPYDLALFWCLACLFAALGPAPGWRDSVLAGLLGCIAFVTYNGYWAFVGCSLVIHVLAAGRDWWAAARRGTFAFVGLAGTFGLLLAFAGAFGVNLLQSYASFAGTVNQGDFQEGHLVLWDYLRRVEAVTFWLWLAALAAIAVFWRTADPASRRRVVIWSALTIALTAILVIGSDGMKAFVVYGRLARQVAPGCALVTGWSVAKLARPSWRAVSFVAIVAAGLASQAVPLRQEFPSPGFYQRALRAMEDYRRQHPEEAKPAFRLLFVGFIWPYPDEKPIPGSAEVLLSSPHPLAWRPYLYEGFNHDQRNRIEQTDITMRLLLMKD